MESDRSNSDAPQSWGQRHGLTIMMVVMAVLFAVVIIVQMKT